MSPGGTVAEALAQARARGVAPLDARLMLGRLLGQSPTRLIAHDEQPLGEAVARWADWLERRARGEPLAYLLGEKEFHGLMLEVTPDVLVPRPETELLVDWAGELLRGRPEPATVVDLGTGSGAIALAVKHAHPLAQVTATDVSAAALGVARRNAERLGLEVEFVEASWWQGLEGRSFAIVVANPPYIRAGDAALASLGHEPLAALTPGADGLAALRAIVDGASAHLDASGWLLLEHGFDQAEDVRGLLAAARFEAVATRADLAGHPRASGGRRPARTP
ncbi:MAG: peptide chain release factor N(5)-glutamine methyltransferase [Burkholderiales bacterium]|nr:peptide chain release factor N(5)-glutamine methyltransferase [Burkholderiales bacterium]